MDLKIEHYDRWYLRLIAGIFAFFGVSSTIRYIFLDIWGTGFVAASTQALCFGFTAAAVTFFFRPRLGHHAMLVLTLLVLITHAASGPADANAFWFLVAAILLLPILSRRTASA